MALAKNALYPILTLDKVLAWGAGRLMESAVGDLKEIFGQTTAALQPK